ncbi:MAG: hypothetical protein M9890_03325 [Thermomicrobiales bacterium]|nr:hypothetical protein [Thermomicrobiales bacterium]
MREQIAFAAYAVLVIGVLILLASLFADPLALGRPGTGFGWKQLLGVLIGLAITYGGYRLVRRVERG